MSSGLGFTNSSNSNIKKVLQLYQPLRTNNKGNIYEDDIKDKFSEQEKNNIIDAFLKRIREDFVKHYIDIKPEPVPVAKPIPVIKQSPPPSSSSSLSPTSPTPHPARNLNGDLKSSVMPKANIVKPKSSNPTEEPISELQTKFNQLFGNKRGGSLQSYDLIMENIRQQLGIN